MIAWIRERLSYANVIATLALFLTLGGGTAIALNGTNTVDSGDIINGQVRGVDVKESSLATVPNARRVGGVRANALVFRTNGAAGLQKTFTLPNGFKLIAKCEPGDLSVTAVSGKDNATVAREGVRAGDFAAYAYDSDFDRSADPFNVINGDEPFAGTLTYVSPATASDQGAETTITYQGREHVLGSPDTKECVFAGTALTAVF